MALVLSEVRRAFIIAGVDEAQAEKAAAEIAGYENRFNAIESTQRLHSWMLAYLVTLLTGIAIKLFA
jgi:hypothetical protein